MSDLEIEKEHFIYPEDFNPVYYLKYCFGIITPTDDGVQEIELSFSPLQGR